MMRTGVKASDADIREIYLAGGCFWGLEDVLQDLEGVTDAVSGYANGDPDLIPDYMTVCSGRFGYCEAVRVEYDANRISLDAILFVFFSLIDPTSVDAQGNDRGIQYRSGIYWTDSASEETVRRVIGIESERYGALAVEIGPLVNFQEAEEYHQDYLKKNANGYCHIPPGRREAVRNAVFDPAMYRRPDEAGMRKGLTDIQYKVARLGLTEHPYTNEFCDSEERGLYVDVVTGEPLFYSQDKYRSSCGWPSFCRPADPNAVVELPDDSRGARRTEVRSRAGNSHLGHVFFCEPESPNGTRYCINSASLRFIPYGEMEKEGYGYLRGNVK